MKHIYKHRHLSEEETRKYIRQIVSAVDHLHRAGILHRYAIATNTKTADSHVASIC